MQPNSGGQGVSIQREETPKGDGQIPKMGSWTGGVGVDVQRREIRCRSGMGSVPLCHLRDAERGMQQASSMPADAPCDGSRLRLRG